MVIIIVLWALIILGSHFWSFNTVPVGVKDVEKKVKKQSSCVLAIPSNCNVRTTTNDVRANSIVV